MAEQDYKDKRIYGGIWTDIHPSQHTLLGAGIVFGSMLAYYHHTWFTFSAAFIGTALTLMMRFTIDRPWFGALLSRPAGRIGEFMWRAFHKVARGWCYISLGKEVDEEQPRRQARELKEIETPEGKIQVKELQAVEPLLDRASSGYQLLLRILKLSDYTRGLVRKNLPHEYRCLVYSSFLRTPMQYVQWATMGLLMMAVFAGGIVLLFGGQASSSHHTLQKNIPFDIDFAFGLLIVVSTIRDSLKDTNKKASQSVRDRLPMHMLDVLYGLQKIGELSVHESDSELSRLRKAVRIKGNALAEFDSRFRGIKEQFFTLVVLCFAILCSYVWGAGIVYIALAFTLQVMIQWMLALTKRRKGLRAKIASVSNRAAFVEDARSLPALRSIAPPGAMIHGIHRTNEEIATIKSESHSSFELQRVISRLVFFSMFALAAILPLYQVYEHELGTRRALLFWISLTGFWLSMSILAENSNRVVEILTEDLEEVEEAVEVIIQETDPPPPDPNAPPKPAIIPPRKAECADMVLDGVRIGIPFHRTYLRTDPIPVRIPFSPGLCKVVKVLGRPRSHKSFLLDALAGSIDPKTGTITSGAIKFNDYESHERDRLTYFSYLPRLIPVFPKLKIIELFQEYRNIGPTPEEDPFEKAKFINALEVHTRKILADFDRLIDELEVPGQEDRTGVNLMLGEQGMFIDEEQNRMLYYALQYSAMLERYEQGDMSFDPDVLIIDGLYFIRSWKRREKVLSMFRKICDKTHTTLVVAIENPNDLYDDDFVITILEPRDFSPNQELEAETDKPKEKWSNLIAGGVIHSKLYGHSDEHKRMRYRKFLASLRGSISRSKNKANR